MLELSYITSFVRALVLNSVSCVVRLCRGVLMLSYFIHNGALSIMRNSASINL